MDRMKRVCLSTAATVLLAGMLCAAQGISSFAQAQIGKGTSGPRAMLAETQSLANRYRSKPAPAIKSVPGKIEKIAFDNFVPTIKPPGNLRAVLRAFAEGIAGHDWNGLLAFFDHGHLSAQLNLYLNDGVMFNWLGKAGQRDVGSVVRLYLYETMQLSLHGGTGGDVVRDDMDTISAISFRDLKDGEGLWVLSFIVEFTDGRKSRGELYVQQNNLKFTGPVG